jgi:hypothetical protein
MAAIRYMATSGGVDDGLLGEGAVEKFVDGMVIAGGLDPALLEKAVTTKSSR